MLGNHSSSSSSLSITKKIDKELDFYTHSPNVKTDRCPLTWWKDKQKETTIAIESRKKVLKCVCN